MVKELKFGAGQDDQAAALKLVVDKLGDDRFETRVEVGPDGKSGIVMVPKTAGVSKPISEKDVEKNFPEIFKAAEKIGGFEAEVNADPYDLDSGVGTGNGMDLYNLLDNFRDYRQGEIGGKSNFNMSLVKEIEQELNDLQILLRDKEGKPTPVGNELSEMKKEFEVFKEQRKEMEALEAQERPQPANAVGGKLGEAGISKQEAEPASKGK